MVEWDGRAYQLAVEADPHLAEIQRKIDEAEKQRKELANNIREWRKEIRSALESSGTFAELQPIEVLDLSVRTFNSLKREGYYHIDQILEIIRADRVNHLREIRNFGDKAFDELMGQLAKKGFLIDKHLPR